METLELRSDSTCDCWVLEPIEGFKPRISKTRQSTETVSSSFGSLPPSPSSFSAQQPPVEPLSKSGLSSPLYFYLPGFKNLAHQGSLGKIVDRFWTCFKPKLDSSRAAKKDRKQGTKKSAVGDASTKTRSSVQSPLSHHHAEYYSAMSLDEQAENLKELIIYCRKSGSPESAEAMADNSCLYRQQS